MMVRPGRVCNSFPSQQILSFPVTAESKGISTNVFFFCCCCFPPVVGKERSEFISSCDCSLPRKQGHNSVTVTMWNYKGLHYLPRLGLLPTDVQSSVEEKIGITGL